MVDRESILVVWSLLAVLGSANNKTMALVVDQAEEIVRLSRQYLERFSSDIEVWSKPLFLFGRIMRFDSTIPLLLEMFPMAMQRLRETAEQEAKPIVGALGLFGQTAVLVSDRRLKRKLVALSDFECLGKLRSCGVEELEFSVTFLLCHLIGDDPHHPLTKKMLDCGLIGDFAVPLSELSVSGGAWQEKSWVGEYCDLSFLIPLSVHKHAAQELAALSVPHTCAKICKVAENPGIMTSLRQGQASALTVLRNFARHSSQMKQSVMESLIDVHLDRFTLHEDAAIREAAARLQLQLADEPQGGEDGALPAEVQARGSKAEALYRRALLGGVAKINWAKLVLLGEDRAGKTSVLAALAGADYDSNTESTHGVASACYRLAAGVWKEEQHANLHNELVAASVAEGMRDSGDEGDEEPEGVEIGLPEAGTTGSAPVPKMGPTDDFKRARGAELAEKSQNKDLATKIKSADDVHVTDVPIDLIAAALKADSKSLRVVCKDTAGQPRYYSMLARTLSKCSMPMVVFSLVRWAKHVLKNKNFEGSHVDLHLHCGSRATGDTEEEKTVGSELIFFRYWLSMILVRTRDAPIYVVGTRVDDIARVAVGNQKLIRQVLQDLSKVIEEVAKSVGVLDRIKVNTAGFGMDTLIFPVDNSFSIEQNGVEVLQESIFETLSEDVETGFLSQKIPLLWVKLLDILRATATDRPLMTVAEIVRIAEHFELLDSTDDSDPQVRSALEYFNDIGEICYFGDAGHELRRLVFVDPESLALAQANILDCPRAVKKMTPLSSELHEDGVLHDELLHEIWRALFKNLDKKQKRAGPQTQNEPIDRKHAFINFLVSSDFLVPMTPGSTRQLWVPSVLPVWHPGQSAPRMFQTLLDDPPLEIGIFMDLKGISLPELFPRLVAELLNSKGFERVNRSLPKLYRNAAQVNTTNATLTAILRPPLDAREVIICAHLHSQDTGAVAQAVIFQSIVDILHKVVKKISPALSERIVVGPAIMDEGGHVITSLAELSNNVNKEALMTRCEQLDGRMVKRDELPPWLRELLFPSLGVASVSGASVHAVRGLRSEADEEKPEPAADGKPTGGNAGPAQNEEPVEVEGLLQLCETAKLPPNAKLVAAAWCQENGVVDICEVLDDSEEFIACLELKKFPEKRLRTALETLREELVAGSDDEGGGGATATGDKFIVIAFGEAQDAALGIEKLLGLSKQDRIAGEAKGLDAIREDIQRAGSKEDQDNLKYILEGVAQKEEDLPPHVIQDYGNGFYHGGKISKGDYDKGHGGMTFQDFMQHKHVVEASLTEAEVCATRLYTTNSYRLYNSPLRQNVQPHPIAMTVFFLVCALKKSRAVAANQPGFAKEEEFWRGLKDAKLANLDKFKAEGGTELAAMSTTKSLDAARAYSESRRPLLFKFTASGMSKGVSLEFLSVYPLEEEYLYPPGTYLCPKRQVKKPSGGPNRKVDVIEVEPQFPS